MRKSACDTPSPRAVVRRGVSRERGGASAYLPTPASASTQHQATWPRACFATSAQSKARRPEKAAAPRCARLTSGIQQLFFFSHPPAHAHLFSLARFAPRPSRVCGAWVSRLSPHTLVTRVVWLVRSRAARAHSSLTKQSTQLTRRRVRYMLQAWAISHLSIAYA